MKNRIFLLIFILWSMVLNLNLFGAEIRVSKTAVKQGEFFIVHLPKGTRENSKGKVVFSKSNTPLKIYSLDGERVVFVPVHYSTQVGKYLVEMYEGEKSIFSEKISVIDGEFEKSYITVNAKTQEKKSDKNVKKMINYARQSRGNPTSEKLWTGEFIYPLEGRISSSFGATRYINNKVSGYHSGTDFAVPIGTPIKSVNRGKIVLAMYLNSTGNTVIIDHGFNLFSSYSHLDSLNVKEGDLVETGKIIGKSGNTGFSTGPHLHFTMSIGNTFVDPFLFFGKELF